MRRIVLITALVALMSGVASADLPFTSIETPNVLINEGETYTVTHDLSIDPPALTVPPDVITSANLTLYFDDDPTTVWGYEVLPYDLALEFAWVDIAGGAGGSGSWVEVGGWVGQDELDYSIDTDWLNLNSGILPVDVTIENWNDHWFFGTHADIYLTQSELSGTYVPVPGAVLLGMLGLSVVGVKLRKRA